MFAGEQMGTVAGCCNFGDVGAGGSQLETHVRRESIRRIAFDRFMTMTIGIKIHPVAQFRQQPQFESAQPGLNICLSGQRDQRFLVVLIQCRMFYVIML